ncbi:MAG TPA: nuclear transport factor 2 family protein [Anaerolineae bacterium]|nr:nuclear transport factor 2 family protein [Anaerolineae bacterium]HNS53134.1 nuclear transport factor 2 family protein [Anaerolineae bacterium]
MSRPTYTKPEGATHEVIEMECAALVRWGMGDPSGFLEIYAPDIVYFDPGCERRIDGLAALTERYEAIRGRVLFDRFELINPLVQLVGDAAVLTYNYASYQGQKAPSRWNCTEVYRRAGGRWQIIQSHWSLTVPTPA